MRWDETSTIFAKESFGIWHGFKIIAHMVFLILL
jgi:hypothetical protein